MRYKQPPDTNLALNVQFVPRDEQPPPPAELLLQGDPVSEYKIIAIQLVKSWPVRVSWKWHTALLCLRHLKMLL